MMQSLLPLGLLFTCLSLDQAEFRIQRPLLDASLLRYEGVRKELKITAGQESKVMRAFREMRSQSGPTRGGTAAIIEAMIDRESRVLAFLTSSQKVRLKQLNFQTSRATIATHPDLIKVLGTTQAQIRRINNLQIQAMMSIRGKKGAAYEELNRRWIEASFNVLTPAQKKKLTSMMGKRVDTKKLLTGFFPYVSEKAITRPR